MSVYVPNPNYGSLSARSARFGIVFAEIVGRIGLYAAIPFTAFRAIMALYVVYAIEPPNDVPWFEVIMAIIGDCVLCVLAIGFVWAMVAFRNNMRRQLDAALRGVDTAEPKATTELPKPNRHYDY